MTMALISHPDCLLHDMGHAHPECPMRLQVINNELTKSGLDVMLQSYLAPLVTRNQLLRVHTAEYVDFLFTMSPSQGLVSLDPDTWMNSHTLTAALRAAGAVVLGVDLVMKDEVNAAFCSIRPPGHHAERNKAMGFCFFNNVAVGVAHALEHYQLNRIAIVDFDVHHGNGTENIFAQDKRVLYCSSFQSPFYPFCGANTQSDHILNVPLPAGTTGKVFRSHVEKAWFHAISDFRPELIFISAGFDGHYQDDMSGWMLNEDDYVWISQEIKKIADHVCSGRIISVLEGGYALEVLGKCVAAHIKALW